MRQHRSSDGGDVYALQSSDGSEAEGSGAGSTDGEEHGGRGNGRKVPVATLGCMGLGR